MIQTRRRHHLARLHLLLAELHVYSALAQAAMVAVLHIDDFEDTLEDSHFANHGIIPDLRRIRWLLLDFRQQCRRASEVITWRLEQLSRP